MPYTQFSENKKKKDILKEIAPISFRVLLRSLKENPLNHIMTISVALVPSSKRKQDLQLRVPHTLHTGLGETVLDLTSPPPRGLEFSVL